MEDFTETQMAVFDYIVDLLVDMSDPPPEEEQEALDDMNGVTAVLFEALDFKVVGVDGDTIVVHMKLT